MNVITAAAIKAAVFAIVPASAMTPARGHKATDVLNATEAWGNGRGFASFYTKDGYLIRCFGFDGATFEDVKASRFCRIRKHYADVALPVAYAGLKAVA